MREEIQREYRHAKTVSQFGCTCLYLMAALLGALAALTCLALPQTPDPPGAHLGVGVIKQVTSLVATISLAEFLRSFGKDGRPFGRGQSVRLAVAGSLIVLSTLLDLFTPALTWSIRLVDGSAPVNISTQPGIDPMMVSLAVFFACLALVVRYGNALKEDSDSIA